MADPDRTGSTPANSTALATATWRELFAVFFWLGLSSFGGMWAATRKIEDTLVLRKRWLGIDEQNALMVAATLIPAPKFLAFGGMVGFRLGGWRGSFVAASALLSPGALLVLIGVMLLTPEVVGTLLAPLQRAVGIGLAGLLLGNAVQQVKNAKATPAQRLGGGLLALAVVGATVAGVPLLVAALVGLVAGALLMRRGRPAAGGRP